MSDDVTLCSRLPGYLLERIAMDIMGPIRPGTKHGNFYILVVEDYFSKYVEAYPLPDHTAQTVADVYVSEWVARYGTGRELHTDQGAEFQSQLFKAILELLGVKKTRTAPYRPQSDGTVERVNRALKNILTAYVQRDYEICAVVVSQFCSSIYWLYS
jgi:transposase InsO family protein